MIRPLILSLLVIFGLPAMSQDKILHYKLSPSLQELFKSETILNSQDSIDIIVATNESLVLHNLKGRVLQKYGSAKTYTIRIKPNELKNLLPHPDFLFASNFREPREEITTGSFDLGINAFEYVHHIFPSQNGEGIKVSIKEQNFDTSDIDFRNRWQRSEVVAPTTSSHASIMATMIAGGANTSPMAKGVAWGSMITSSNFANLLPDADSVYVKNNISIQNHSYGTGIENFYGADAFSYDKNVLTIPTLLHVFSSGNSGTATSVSGKYSGIPGMANLTGSFKMSKNTITAGATDSFFNIVSSSSRGPAFDGRIKPEIVAYGEGGSSGAAALVSGSIAILQQEFRSVYNQLPEASLIKAVLINSARDVGNRYPDFISGYGSLNLSDALKTIKESKFLNDQVTQGEIKNFPLIIPANTENFKVTIAWTDTVAGHNPSKVLVNDLDIRLIHNATGDAWLPWVLNHAAHKDSLLQLAERKIDTLNNVEQITLELPEPGSYTLEVRGTKLSSSQQKFSIAFQYDSLQHFSWIFPTGNSGLAANRSAVLRWQTNLKGLATIEYKTEGSNWSQITPTAQLEKEYFSWKTPDIDSKIIVRLRENQSGRIIETDSFTVSRTVSLKVGFDCQESFLLYWNRINAANYKVYALGEKYMEMISTSIDSAKLFTKDQSTALYYAVAPEINGKTGIRSFTINYKLQGVGCYFKNFLTSVDQDKGLLSTSLGTTYGIQSLALQKLKPSGFVTIKDHSPNSTNFNFIDSFLTQGVNVYRIALNLHSGEVIYSNVENIYYFPVSPVIVYPNPAQQNERINFLAQENDEYNMQVFDASGRMIFSQMLKEMNQGVSGLRLSKGIYIIQFTDRQQKRFSKKLVVL
jgi:hypothetical protein